MNFGANAATVAAGPRLSNANEVTTLASLSSTGFSPACQSRSRFDATRPEWRERISRR